MPDEAAAATDEFNVRVDHLLQCACETARALFSDKVDGGDFYEEDERRLQHLSDVAAVGVDALRKVRSLRFGEPAPAATLESSPRFVVIESA